jgi:hypothetical protein
MHTEPWKTKVLEAKAFLAHLRRFFAQTKPLEFGRKKNNVIILKSEIKWGLEAGRKWSSLLQCSVCYVLSVDLYSSSLVRFC